MLMILLSSSLIIIILMMLILINLMISKKSFNDREKNSPFECGFDPKSSPRIPFSLHFFLIAMIFLIFDVEITLLMPIIYTLKICNPWSLSMTFSVFILILILGTLHEWNQGALNWSL